MSAVEQVDRRLRLVYSNLLMTEVAQYHNIETSDYFAERMAEMELIAPIIRTTDHLDVRMRRGNRTLDVNEGELLKGLMAVEPEKPLTITFDSLPKQSPIVVAKPQINAARAEAVIEIDPNLSTKALKKGAERKLNVAFWSGVVVLDALEGDGRDHFRAEKDRKSAKMSLKQNFAVMLGPLVLGEAVIVETHRSALGMSIILGGQLGARIGLGARHAYVRRMPFDEFVVKQTRDRAEDMAKAHPVLSQGFRLGQAAAL